MAANVSRRPGQLFTEEIVMPTLLTYREEFTVGPLIGLFDAEEFKKQKGVSFDLHPDGNVLTSSYPSPAIKIHAFDVSEESNAEEVFGAMFGKEELKWFWPLAFLISAQINGEEGRLTTRFGSANLFFIDGIVLRVWWHERAGQWNLRDEERGFCGLNQGDRVFGPANRAVN